MTPEYLSLDGVYVWDRAGKLRVDDEVHVLSDPTEAQVEGLARQEAERLLCDLAQHQGFGVYADRAFTSSAAPARSRPLVRCEPRW